MNQLILYDIEGEKNGSQYMARAHLRAAPL